MSRPDLDRYRIAPGARVHLDQRATDEKPDFDKATGAAAAAKNLEALDALQERLYAEGEQALLVVLQAMDGGGKDSTIQRVFGGMNPQGVLVHGFKSPTTEELGHDFLWRVHARTPRHGQITVFNRSHYEDVLIVRVHEWATPETIEQRYDHIAAFERLLADARTRVVKVLLHVSKEYQLEQFRERLTEPEKHWKFNPGDLAERARWDDYQSAFEVAIERTSTEEAPWYVVPAEKKWYRDLVVSQIVREALEAMDPQFPKPSFDPAAYPPDSLK
ncbi:MAG TPA: polyphosphate kinase 2 family protein [Rhodothermales bacterium]|nr:polyphosphate kinase 2 family protein [Rhodothermales bacterium]